MSLQTLYRKYRPDSFARVIGQDHIVSVLKGSLKNETTTHAYLFSGSRGTGKTSVARILARELGCKGHDLYEIDAASNRGIDEIRELREAVNTLPFESKVKVYIIDEVHMLTKEAWNALLKTVEEPPAHVIFILATTDLAKVPDTIISRCQTFVFKRPTNEILKKLVVTVGKEEGYIFDEGAASVLAFLGDGSFRDTLGLVQKVISSSKDKKITTKEVEAITGAPSSWLVYNLILTTLNHDLAGALSVVAQAVAENKDINLFIRLLLREVRLAMLLKYSPDLKTDIFNETDKDEEKFLTEVVIKPTSTMLPDLLRELLVASLRLENPYVPQLPLELALVKLLTEK
ncbi:MAG: DNA polymerase III subunit gamma/tau [Candidatus Vogelbacteria bacterium]|nr:DNA polymerase III subunit gamma/tau [Candidatus Vogelbacteria bacterium]